MREQATLYKVAMMWISREQFVGSSEQRPLLESLFLLPTECHFLGIVCSPWIMVKPKSPLPDFLIKDGRSDIGNVKKACPLWWFFFFFNLLFIYFQLHWVFVAAEAFL